MRIFQLPRRHQRCTSFPVGFVDDGSRGSFHPGLLRDFEELVDGQYIQSSQVILLCLLVNKAVLMVQWLYLCPLLFHKVAFPVTNNLAKGFSKFTHNIIIDHVDLTCLYILSYLMVSRISLYHVLFDVICSSSCKYVFVDEREGGIAGERGT